MFSDWDKNKRSFQVVARVRNSVEDVGGYLKPKVGEVLGEVSLKEAADLVHRLGGKMPDGPTHDAPSTMEVFAKKLAMFQADPDSEMYKRMRNHLGNQIGEENVEKMLKEVFGLGNKFAS